jgi:hypothetical protein
MTSWRAIDRKGGGTGVDEPHCSQTSLKINDYVLAPFAEAGRSALSTILEPRVPPIIGVLHTVPALFQLLSTRAAQLAVFQASFNFSAHQSWTP